MIREIVRRKDKNEMKIAVIVLVIGENVRAALLIGNLSSTCSTWRSGRENRQYLIGAF